MGSGRSAPLVGVGTGTWAAGWGLAGRGRLVLVVVFRLVFDSEYQLAAVGWWWWLFSGLFSTVSTSWLWSARLPVLCARRLVVGGVSEGGYTFGVQLGCFG